MRSDSLLVQLYHVLSDSSIVGMHDNGDGKAPSVLASLGAGAVSGGLAKTAIAPFDRTKINFQVSRTRGYSFKAAIKFLKISYQTEGFLALYRGNSATLARVVPYAAIQFAAHERCKFWLSVDKGGERTPVKRYIAGSFAGVIATICTYPLDTAKARLSTSTKHEYAGIADVFKKVSKAEGMFALYRGMLPTLVGVIPYAGTSFFTFETLNLLYKEEMGAKPNALFVMLFGAVAGLVGQSSSYPLDIVRRRMQTARAPEGMNMLQVLSHIARTEGVIRGLYKGLSMNWLKGPISVGVSYTTFNFAFPAFSSYLNSFPR